MPFLEPFTLVGQYVLFWVLYPRTLVFQKGCHIIWLHLPTGFSLRALFHLFTNSKNIWASDCFPALSIIYCLLTVESLWSHLTFFLWFHFLCFLFFFFLWLILGLGIRLPGLVFKCYLFSPIFCHFCWPLEFYQIFLPTFLLDFQVMPYFFISKTFYDYSFKNTILLLYVYNVFS